MAPDDGAAVLFRVVRDDDGRLLATVRYLESLGSPSPQNVVHVVGREAIFTALGMLLDAVDGHGPSPTGEVSDGVRR